MNVDSAAAYLADSIEGAASRGNIVEIPPQAARLTPPPKLRRPSLKAAGGDVDWCGKRHSELTPEGVHVKKLSESLRHGLKKFHKEKQNVERP